MIGPHRGKWRFCCHGLLSRPLRVVGVQVALLSYGTIESGNRPDGMKIVATPSSLHRGGATRPAAEQLPAMWGSKKKQMRTTTVATIAALYVIGQGVTPHISAAYWAIVRSLENLPEAATLRIALRDHACGSAYNASSR